MKDNIHNLKNNPKAIAVIQGPLVSFGQSKNLSAKGFNVVKTIIKNIKILNEFKIKVVVSSWIPSNEKETEALKKLSKKIPKNNKLILNKEPRIYDIQNRYKQQLSTIKGLEYFKNYPSMTPTFKLRTDQEYEESIIEYCLNSNINKYLVSEILDFPFYLGDFLHYSNFSNIYNFFLNSITWGNDIYFHPAAVQDFTIKNIIHKNRLNKIISKSIFGKIFLCISCLKEWRKVHTNFHSLPAKLYFKIKWRGIRISEVIKNPPLINSHNTKKIKAKNIELIKYIYEIIKNFLILYFQIVLIKRITKIKRFFLIFEKLF